MSWGTTGRARRAWAVVGAVAVTASLTAGAASTQAVEPETADPETGPLIAGDHSYVDGTYVWTDYAYDDHGPNSNGLDGGDATYPDRPHPGNTADFVQVQISTLDTGELHLNAVLSTLVDGADALVGIGFDTDSDERTGAHTVPGGGWNNRDALGLELLALVGTDGSGSLQEWDGSAWADAGHGVAVAVDRDRNVVSAIVDGLQPGAATWRAVSMIGMADDTGSWHDGAHPIHDLGFVRGEDPTEEVLVALREQVPQLGFVPWQDKEQADVLAGSLPAGHAVASVELGSARHELSAPIAGWNTFLYHSRVVLAEEGVTNADASIEYFGVYQPYGVLVPEADLSAGLPMVVMLHGANQYQNVNRVHFSTQGLVIPGAYDVRGVVIFPNGRTTGWGSDLAEKDALDAVDDAVARLNIDEDRIVLSGISSGGAGTFRLAARWPDRWTGGFSIVGGGTTTLENLTNLPFRAANGALDPLVNIQTWKRSADALAAAETVDYRITLVHNRSHDGPIAEGNCYFVDLISRDRDLHPARVRYTTVPADYVNDPERNLVLEPRGAYWVSAMQSRSGDPASIDAVSGAKPPRVAAADILAVDENVTKTADFCGPHPTLRGGNNWSTQGRRFVVDDGAELTNELAVIATNLAEATIDIDRAELDLAQPATITVTSDGPTTLHLLRPGTNEDPIHVEVGAGESTVTLTPA